MGHSKISSKREAYSDTCLPQQTRNISNVQSNLALKGARIRTKFKVHKKFKNQRDQSRNRDYKSIEKTTNQINETKSWFFEKLNKIQPD